MSKFKFAICSSVVLGLSLLPVASKAKQEYFISAQAGGAFPMSKLSHDTSEVGNKKKKPKNDLVFGIGAGKEVYDSTYVELEVAYSNYKYKDSYTDSVGGIGAPATFKSKIKSINGFANLSYRFSNISTLVVPYLTAGVGVASNQTKDATLSVQPNITLTAKGKKKTDLAWQVGAGVLLPVARNVDVNLSYKYRDLGQIKTSNTVTGLSEPLVSNAFFKGKLRTSNILLGVNVNF